MIKMTSRCANKMITRLNEDRDYWHDIENENALRKVYTI